MLGNMLTRFSWTIKLARGRLGTRKLSLFRGFSTDFNRSLNKFRTSNIFSLFFQSSESLEIVHVDVWTILFPGSSEIQEIASITFHA